MLVLLVDGRGRPRRAGAALAEEIALGIGVGIVVPLVVLRLERLPFLAATKDLEPLLAVSIGLLVLAICLRDARQPLPRRLRGRDHRRHLGPRASATEFEQFGELVTELLKLAAILVFGALITPTFLFQEIALTGWVFAALALVAARPLALLRVLRSARTCPRRSRLAAMWFGPKGFASVVYGLLVLESGIARADELFHLIALVIVLSILAHSSTDVVVARQFDEPEEEESPAQA